MRESAQSWKELLVDLKARGLSIAPEIAVGDGALGFWKALGQRFDAVDVSPLIEGFSFEALIADKAFDSNAIIADLDARGAKVVIS